MALIWPLDFLWNNGVGQNLTAGVIVFLLGVAWSRTSYWPLHAIHVRLDRLHESHERLHASHAELHRKLDALERSSDRGTH